MSKRHVPKYKIDRRLGLNLWGRPKSPFNKRESAPGQHGAKRPKVTDYGAQMIAKQKLKGYYGNIGERRFRSYYFDAVKRPGDTGANFLGLLESRLDSVVYRAKFVPTVFAARQFINHGHILVNGQRVNIPSYGLRPHDCIEVRESSQTLASVIESMALPERDVPNYIQPQDRGFKVIFLHIPEPGDIPYPVRIETNLVIEYYSM